MAKIFSSDLAFDPTNDSIEKADGSSFVFEPPSGVCLPKNGYENADEVYTPRQKKIEA